MQRERENSSMGFEEKVLFQTKEAFDAAFMQARINALKPKVVFKSKMSEEALAGVARFIGFGREAARFYGQSDEHGQDKLLPAYDPTKHNNDFTGWVRQYYEVYTGRLKGDHYNIADYAYIEGGIAIYREKREDEQAFSPYSALADQDAYRRVHWAADGQTITEVYEDLLRDPELGVGSKRDYVLTRRTVGP